MDKISPKKYIETKARTLPIDKCYVNRDWQISKMADVFIFRKHITGNITWGAYLIDLLCLGVKDSWYNFNVPTDEISELLEKFEANGLIEIDYNLAHNIIFAGYDFATNIGLPAHKEFALTKFILEEDDDRIPIIDIEVGDEDGTPHLMINEDGAEKWAIAILNKSIGEGEYYLSNIDDEDDEDDEDYEDHLPKSLDLDDYEIGSITPEDTQYLTDETIRDIEKIKKRELNEILSISVELGIREYELEIDHIPMSNEVYYNTPEYGLLENIEGRINSTNGLIPLFGIKDAEKVDVFIEMYAGLKGKKAEKTLHHIFDNFKNNFYALFKLYNITTIVEESKSLKIEVCKALHNFSNQFPLAILLLAFESAFFTPDIRFTKIIYSNSIQECFPEYKTFSTEELLVYWLIKLQHSIKTNDFERCCFFYKLIADTMWEFEPLVLVVQQNFIKYLGKLMEEE